MHEEHFPCPARGAARSDAPQMRDLATPRFGRSRSAAHHFVLRCARDTGSNEQRSIPMTYQNFQSRRRRRRHRARHLGQPGPVDERHRQKVMEELDAPSSSRSRPTPPSRARWSPPARTRSAPAPTSPCWKASGRSFAEIDAERKARKPPTRETVRGVPEAAADLPAAGDQRQAVGRGHQRHRARRRLRALPRLPSSRRRPTIRRRASACPRSRSGCSPAPAARSASRA